MCYKYASGTILFIDIFAICKYFKTIFMSASCKTTKNRNKRFFKIQDCLQACVIKQGHLHLTLDSVYIYLYMHLSIKSLVNSIHVTATGLCKHIFITS